MEGMVVDGDDDEGVVGFEDDGKEEHVGARAQTQQTTRERARQRKKKQKVEQKKEETIKINNKNNNIFFLLGKAIMCCGRYKKGQVGKEKKK